jgi:hypothetical protein
MRNALAPKSTEESCCKPKFAERRVTDNGEARSEV